MFEPKVRIAILTLAFICEGHMPRLADNDAPPMSYDTHIHAVPAEHCTGPD